MRAHPHIHTVAAVLAFASLLVFGTSTALAEQRGHVTTPREFGSGLLKEPDGVAVNEETGIVYVADSGNNRVAMFNGSTGAFEGQINGSGTLTNKGVAEEKAAGGGTAPDEEPTGAFSDPSQIAVDNSCEQQKPKLTGAECEKFDPSNGDVYVIDSGHDVVDKYTATGKYVGQITRKTLEIDEEEREVEEPEKHEKVRIKEELLVLEGVAVEASGDVLVSARVSTPNLQEGVFRLADLAHNKLLPSPGDPVGFTWAARVGFLYPALGAADGRVFVEQGSPGGGEISVWSSEGALLAGGPVREGEVQREVPPLYRGPIGGLGSESCTGDVYVDTGVAIDRYEGGHLEGSGGPRESLPVPGGAAPEHQGVGYGVTSDCASLSVFAVDGATGVVDAYGPEPAQEPKIEAGSGFASKVSDDGAKLSATINPRTEPGEGETTFVFEYGPCPAEGSCAGAPYGHSAKGSVPDEYGPVGISAELRGLAADTRYHYRLSAYNKYDPEPGEQVLGEELTFTTQASFPGGLLDERGWELVTPPDKRGAEIEPIAETGVIQAAGDGSGITYVASAPTEAGPTGNTNKVQALSVRGENGWASCDLSLAHAAATGVSLGEGQEYRAFGNDLQAGLAWPLGGFVPGLAPGAREVSPLLVGLSGSCGSSPSYEALLSGCPEVGEPCEPIVREHADVEPGIEVAEESFCRENVFCAAEPLGTNPSLSAVVLQSNPPLIEDLPEKALYEWSGGHVYPVSVSPGGGIVGGLAHFPALGSRSLAGVSSRGAVSEDGSRVVWSEDASGGHLFVWDRASGKSVQVDTVQKEASGKGNVDPVFQFATADGSKVFFTDTQALTTDSGADSDHADLYECEVVIEGEGEESKPACALHDLTPETATHEQAGVLGEALGYSSDASTVYFVANGALSSNTISGQTAVKGDCRPGPTADAQCNLYEYHDGTIGLVAAISGEDVDDWGGELPQLTDLTGRVSGNGEWLAFMSNRSLTGYDNRDANSGKPDEEVYLYRGPANGSGSLVCVSCNPTGARPSGVEYERLSGGKAGGTTVWPLQSWLSGFVPGWTPFLLGKAQYQSRYLGESGRIFFDSTDSLLPRDTNGTVDVYEYEPIGVGSCEAGGEGYLSQDKGCLGLVSSGESGEESGFLDASENGNDVFFLTKSQLSKHDTDTSYDIYDARVGGVELPESKPVECQGDACQSPVTPPESLTPSSFTFSGPGNQLTPPAPGSGNTGTKGKPKAKTKQQKLAGALKTCHKTKGKARRKTCEQKARAKYGAIAKQKQGRRRRGK